MAIIKCKMCGGDIELSEDRTIGTCESCGSKVTLPRIDDDQRAAAFNRGNHFRRIGEFDKALAVYERIVQEDDADAEAHWCCALCRFGIEYVEDPTTYEWLPTCHRASFDSFLEDVDYLAAVEHSDGMTRRQYKKEAERIAEIQRGILATSQSEQPFDVFICYKESDENGERTRDSAIAQDIYYQLTEQGFRVFFARITLEDKVGSQYEPYIFAALNSAKVMIVVGTKPEYVNAVWVKNEWSRFLALMKRDRSKLLLPCYRDMDPYDLPEQLSVLQAYDMSKIGFIQDLIRGVSKVLGADKKPEPARETVVVQSEGGSNNDALLKRGQQALEDGEWQKADGFFDRVLDSDAECAEAFMGKFLAAQKQVSLKQYVDQLIAQARQVRHEVKLADVDRSRIDQAVERCTVPKYLSEEKIRSLYEFNLGYKTTLSPLKKNCDWILRQQWAGEKLLTRAFQFANGAYKEQIESERMRLFDKLDDLVVQAEQQDEKAIAKIREDYARHLDEADQKLAELHAAAEARRQEGEKQAAQRMEEKYVNACKAQEGATSSYYFLYAARSFAALGEYKDSVARAKACEERAATAAQKEKQKKKRVNALIASAIVIAIAAFVALTQFVIPSGHYKAAEEALNAGDYETARAEFAEAGGYKDAAERIPAVYYEQAEVLLAQGDYAGARDAFASAGKYKGAAERILAAYYQEGEELLAQGEYDAARAAFTSAGEYKDAAERILAAYYQEGDDLLAQGEYDAARAAFTSAGEYENAAERILAAYYQKGDDLLAKGEYDAARAAFTSAGEYKDAAERILAAYYQEGDDLLAKGEYDAAWQAFRSAGEYSDASTKQQQWYYQQAESSLAQENFEEAIAFFSQAGDYLDAKARESEYNYLVAEKALASDQTAMAAIYFGKAGDYQDARSRSFALWDNIAQRDTVSGGSSHTVGVKTDGTVEYAGYVDDYRDAKTILAGADWSNIIAVSAGYEIIGLKADGTVVSTDKYDDMSGWSDIVAVSSGYGCFAGLKADGTVVSTKYDTSDWSNIIAISVGDGHMAGLRADGTVVSTKYDTSDWSDIVAVSTGGRYIAGLKADGTVVATGGNTFGQCNVSDWNDIIAISCGDMHTVGLKADGTVVAVGNSLSGRCNVSNWNDIIAISCGETHTVGLKADGTVVAVGYNWYGKTDVSGWENIRVPKSVSE